MQGLDLNQIQTWMNNKEESEQAIGNSETSKATSVTDDKKAVNGGLSEMDKLSKCGRRRRVRPSTDPPVRNFVTGGERLVMHLQGLPLVLCQQALE